MTRRVVTTAMLVLAGLFAVGIWLPSETQAGTRLTRLFAGFKSTSSEKSTSSTTTGVEVFSKTIFVPGGKQTLFVTFSGTGDSHNGAASRLDCFIDGVECNSTFGKVRLQRHSDQFTDSDGDDVFDGGNGEDLHDNGIHYTWCAQSGGDLHTVKLVLTSSDGGEVFVERYFVTIDVSRGKGKNTCVPFVP